MPGLAGANDHLDLTGTVINLITSTGQTHPDHGFRQVTGQEQIATTTQNERRSTVEPSTDIGELLLVLKVHELRCQGGDAKRIQRPQVDIIAGFHDPRIARRR